MCVFLYFSGDGSLTAVDLRQRRLEQQSDHTESELLSLALVKVSGSLVPRFSQHANENWGLGTTLDKGLKYSHLWGIAS